jgi:hypothetical protein
MVLSLKQVYKILRGFLWAGRQGGCQWWTLPCQLGTGVPTIAAWRPRDSGPGPHCYQPQGEVDLEDAH